MTLLATPTFAQTAAPTQAVEAEPFGPAAAFSFDALAEKAAELARAPYAATPATYDKVLEDVTYTEHWKIMFKQAKSLMVNDSPVQFFHLGTYFRQPVKIYDVQDGQAREVVYHRDYFDMPEDSPAMAMGDDAGFAGFRVMRPDFKTDWISFLGGSYFRTDGALHQYGQSARALALDTGLATPEEFPRFTEFYIEHPKEGSESLIVNALLDSPSVSGAYRIAMTNEDGKGQVMDVQSRLFFRDGVERLGVAPLTSMFWYSESNRFASADWRPEVHDTDGLMMISGTGEQIWRPLNNPDRVMASSFADQNPQGFGLMQRDRNFENYQDDGVQFHKRPSVWIEPTSDWGNGAVQLVELPTNDEVFDNIVAFWNPEQKPEAGTEMRFDYRMHWGVDAPVEMPLARTTATRIGEGGHPGNPRPLDQHKLLVEFTGEPLEGLGLDEGVEAHITLPKGAELVEEYTTPVQGKDDTWRVQFDIKTTLPTADLRVYLSDADGTPLTETWMGQIHPQQIAYWRQH